MNYSFKLFYETLDTQFKLRIVSKNEVKDKKGKHGPLKVRYNVIHRTYEFDLDNGIVQLALRYTGKTSRDRKTKFGKNEIYVVHWDHQGLTKDTNVSKVMSGVIQCIKEFMKIPEVKDVEIIRWNSLDEKRNRIYVLVAKKLGLKVGKREDDLSGWAYKEIKH